MSLLSNLKPNLTLIDRPAKSCAGWKRSRKRCTANSIPSLPSTARARHTSQLSYTSAVGSSRPYLASSWLGKFTCHDMILPSTPRDIFRAITQDYQFDMGFLNSADLYQFQYDPTIHDTTAKSSGGRGLSSFDLQFDQTQRSAESAPPKDTYIRESPAYPEKEGMVSGTV